MSDSPIQTLAAKLQALQLTEAESRLLHGIMKQAEASDAESEVAGFADSFSLNFDRMAVLSPTRLRKIGPGCTFCDDVPTKLCSPPAVLG